MIPGLGRSPGEGKGYLFQYSGLENSLDSMVHGFYFSKNVIWGRFPGEGKGYPLQYSSLENSMEGIVHGVAKSQTQLRDFHFSSFTWT